MNPITYQFECPKCGLKYGLRCSEEIFEEDKEKLVICPCGERLAYVEKREDYDD